MFTRGTGLSCLFAAVVLVAFAARAFPQARDTGTPVRDTPFRNLIEPDVSREPPGRLTGRVVRADDGRPIRRVEVQAQSDRLSATAMTDADGRFEMPSLRAGLWTVKLSKPGYAQSLAGRPSAPAGSVRITGGQTASLDLAMKPGAAITGVVVDEQGDPVSGVAVEALYARLVNGRKQLYPVATDHTDDTGAYRLHSLPAGDFYVSARLRSSSPDELYGPAGAVGIFVVESSLSQTFYPGTPNVGAATRVPVRAGDERSGINLSLTAARAVRVSGTVMSASGGPADEAKVELINPGDNSVVARPYGNFGLTQGGGRFGMVNVTPGNYILFAQVDQPGGAETALLPLTVGSYDTAGVMITTRPGVTVSGTIVSAGASQLPALTETRILVRPAEGGLRQSVAPANRTFTLVGPAGPTFIDVDGLPRGWAVLRIEMNGEDVTDVPINLPPGARASIRVVVTNQISKLAGTVSAGATTTTQAGVLVFPANSARWNVPSRSIRSVRTDTSGRFQIEGLPAGEYLAVALDDLPDDEWVDAQMLERFRPGALPITLTEGATATVALSRRDR